MFDPIITSVQINLSAQVVQEYASGLVIVAKQLGLSIQSNSLPYLEKTDFIELIQKVNDIPIPDQSWN